MTAELKPADSVLPLSPAPVGRDVRATCPHCGRDADSVPTPRVITPFGLLLALGRVVVAIGAALSLIWIVVSLSRSGRNPFGPNEILPAFALFAVSIGVLVLYEIRDLLRAPRQPRAESPFAARHIMGSGLSRTQQQVDIWRAIGGIGYFIWLPLQPDRDRLLIDHLTLDEKRQLLHRLAIVTVCVVATTIAPMLIAFAFLSPVAVCMAATAVASNLFVLDWFKKRHKRWLYSTNYALAQSIQPTDQASAENGRQPTTSDIDW